MNGNSIYVGDDVRRLTFFRNPISKGRFEPPYVVSYSFKTASKLLCC
jgi:hypothetical protein